MENRQPITPAPTVLPAHKAEPLPYRAPLLRSHGGVSNLTQKASSEQPTSDRNAKEYIVPVAWA